MLKPLSQRPTPTEGVVQDVKSGVGTGLIFASLYSAFILAMALLRGSTTYEDKGGVTTWQLIAFYFAAGTIGGAVFGLLQPYRTRYIGKLLTAYIILLLVYGGGMIVFLPNITAGDPDPVPLGVLFAASAVLSLVLAPAYVWLVDRS